MPGLVHSLAIVTPTAAADGSVDDYGQPVPGQPVVALVQGLVQPLGVREAAAASQAGPAVYDHRIFLPLMTDPVNGAFIRFHPDDGQRYEIVGTERFDFGLRPHLEVRARRVVSTELAGS